MALQTWLAFRITELGSVMAIMITPLVVVMCMLGQDSESQHTRNAWKGIGQTHLIQNSLVCKCRWSHIVEMFLSRGGRSGGDYTRPGWGTCDWNLGVQNWGGHREWRSIPPSLTPGRTTGRTSLISSWWDITFEGKLSLVIQKLTNHLANKFPCKLTFHRKKSCLKITNTFFWSWSD